MKEASRIDRGSTLVENTTYRKSQSVVKRALQSGSSLEGTKDLAMNKKNLQCRRL